MSDILTSDSAARLPRQVADAYVDDLIAIDPITGTYLGVAASSGQLPDLSPAGRAAAAALTRTTLARLDAAERQPGADSDAERRCARLLRERLNAELAVHEADEDLRAVSNIHSPAHSVREIFSLTPAETDEDWAAIAERLRAVPVAYAGYRECLALGLDRGLFGSPRPTATFIEQLTAWAGEGEGAEGAGKGGYFAEFAATGPQALRAELDAAAAGATAAVVELRDWMRDVYAPAVEGKPDPVGRERYARWSRYFNGADLDLDEAYAYGWSEYHRLLAEMKAEAAKILPDAGPWEALAHLDVHGTHIEGVDEVQAWLQGLMDEAIENLDGTHFELAERVRKVESRIAPPGTTSPTCSSPPSPSRTTAVPSPAWAST
ncbi:DUF885 family protein, partial [Streptomyces sp. NPDC059956]|uniref:DUF885 family protein n=1 Tax=Streptomyces sp. NPDC059956 TaxID=3347015 RepID=UPI0036544313